jgi:hypothetical protein
MSERKVIIGNSYKREYKEVDTFCANCGHKGVWVTEGSDTQFEGVCLECEVTFELSVFEKGMDSETIKEIRESIK